MGGGGVAENCLSTDINGNGIGNGNGNADGTDTGFGIFARSSGDWSAVPTRLRNQYNARDGSCTLTWRCGDGCAMLAVRYGVCVGVFGGQLQS